MNTSSQAPVTSSRYTEDEHAIALFCAHLEPRNYYVQGFDPATGSSDYTAAILWGGHPPGVLGVWRPSPALLKQLAEMGEASRRAAEEMAAFGRAVKRMREAMVRQALKQAKRPKISLTNVGNYRWYDRLSPAQRKVVVGNTRAWRELQQRVCGHA